MSCFGGILLLVAAWTQLALSSQPPHIIFIVVDDLGWGDVSFHGSKQVPTPNIDTLASDGIIFNNYYVSPLCSPSRSALLSGRYPIHTGMQHDVIYNTQPWALPLNFSLMPEHLKRLGYKTHAVGKWHLGFMTEDYTPTRRGFDSFFGYYSGRKDYLDHTVYGVYNIDGESLSAWGIDLWENLTPAKDALGKYTTNLFAEKAMEVIRNHDPNSPLFLYLCHLAVHTANIYPNLEAPQSYIDKFSFIEDPKRRVFAAMLSVLDDTIGELFEELVSSPLINNTIVVLTTDNGGAAGGVDQSAGSNWPLRGSKATLWEGGIRGISFIWSPLLHNGSASNHLMHITDWLPTLYSAAGGSPDDLGDIDGIDMWYSLKEGTPSPRNEILHNIDPIWKMAALRVGNYKIVQGDYSEGQYSKWYPIPGETNETANDVDQLRQNCQVAKSLNRIGRRPRNRVKDVIVKCGTPPPDYQTNCQFLNSTCLFNIAKDPCEYNNLADEYPEVLNTLLDRLSEYNATAVPPLNKPPTKIADPRYHGYLWAPYL